MKVYIITDVGTCSPCDGVILGIFDTIEAADAHLNEWTANHPNSPLVDNLDVLEYELNVPVPE